MTGMIQIREFSLHCVHLFGVDPVVGMATVQSYYKKAYKIPASAQKFCNVDVHLEGNIYVATVDVRFLDLNDIALAVRAINKYTGGNVSLLIPDFVIERLPLFTGHP